MKVQIEKDFEDRISKFKNIRHSPIEGVYAKKNNVLVHCYWGLMRSPTVIASYLIYRYKMDVEGAIEFVKDKKNFSFHNLYNFKEILYFVKEHFETEET